MVCSLGKGKMAVMARLLAAGGFLQTLTEEVGHQKLATQIVFKEFSEAVEPNLLDEDDMHVFGLRPMADLLELVCCNTCKKIVKTSQYAAHAELCRRLKSMEQSVLAVNGSVRPKKLTRKERKKSVTAYANQAMPVEQLERSAGAVDPFVAQSRLDGQIALNPAYHMEAKNSKNSTDGAGVRPGTTHNPVGVKLRPTKRSKLIGDKERQSSGHVSPKGTISTADFFNSDVIEYQMNEQVYRYCSLVKDVPAPLATKIYYSQKKNRLRSALCHLFNASVSSSEEVCCNTVNPELSNGNTYISQAVTEKTNSLSQPSVRNHPQMLAHSSEMYMGSSGVCLPPSDFSEQLPVDDPARPQVASGALARTSFFSKPYSLTGNSGQSLEAVQQQNGSVPVL